MKEEELIELKEKLEDLERHLKFEQEYKEQEIERKHNMFLGFLLGFMAGGIVFAILINIL